jgi:hypothetical protein
MRRWRLPGCGDPPLRRIEKGYVEVEKCKVAKAVALVLQTRKIHEAEECE